MTDQPSEKADKPNLVLLLDQLWGPLEPDVFQDIVWRTFRKKLSTGEGDGHGTEFVVGEFPQFFIQFDGFLFAIFTIPQPYFDEPEEEAKSLRELRSRKAVREHGAHISVSLFNAPADADEDTQWRLLARLTAALGWSRGTLAIFCPAMGEVRPWEKSLRKLLKKEPPQTAFRDYEPSTKTAPVVLLEPEDTEWAKSEAQRRWPEFVAAFARRPPDLPFLVKAPCKDGEHVEHMWISVTSLKDGLVEGTLENEPVEVKRFKRGQKVKLKPHLVSDWICKVGDEVLGNFTEEALARRRVRLDAEDEDEYEEDEDDLDDEDEDELVEEEEAEEAEARPARRPSRSPRAEAATEKSPGLRVGLLIGLAAGGVLVLGAVLVAVLFALGVFGGGSGGLGGAGGNQPGLGSEAHSAEHATRLFFQDVTDGNLDKAYLRTAPAFRRRQSAGQFRDLVSASRLFEGRAAPFTLKLNESQDGNTVVVSSGNPDIQGTLTLRTGHDAGGWWIEDVSAGIPSPLLLQGSSGAEATVNGFAGRMREGDLVAAYAHTSAGYQKRQSLDQFRAFLRGTKLCVGKPLKVSEGSRKPPGQPRFFVGLPGLTAPEPITLHLSTIGNSARIEDVTPGTDKQLERGGSTAGHIGNLFRGALDGGDPEAAYGCLTPAVQKRLSIAQFRAQVAKAFEGATSVFILPGSKPASDTQVTFTIHPKGKEGPAAITIQARREADGWWVGDVTFP
jgi:uncharacterized protein YegJ (DUF2314 family)